MTDYIKQAIEIVKAQASARVMTEDEIINMIQNLSFRLKNMTEESTESEESYIPIISPVKSIKEKSITCLECGKSFKIITRKHLSSHGLDADTYREKWGIKKNSPLVCKELQRERRKKMKEMKLWEKRSAAARGNE